MLERISLSFSNEGSVLPVSFFLQQTFLHQPIADVVGRALSTVPHLLYSLHSEGTRWELFGATPFLGDTAFVEPMALIYPGGLMSEPSGKGCTSNCRISPNLTRIRVFTELQDQR